MLKAAALMVLISCNDSFMHCSMQPKAMQPYATIGACEADLAKGLQSLTDHGQQILGKCIALKPSGEASTASANSACVVQQNIKNITWKVSREGHLYAAMKNSADGKNIDKK